LPAGRRQARPPHQTPRIVEQDIESTEGFERLRDQPPALVELGDVGGRSQRVTAPGDLVNLGSDPPAPVRIDRGDDELCAGSCLGQSHRSAQTAIAAGHDDDAPVERNIGQRKRGHERHSLSGWRTYQLYSCCQKSKRGRPLILDA
jgi:hypothetical protein